MNTVVAPQQNPGGEVVDDVIARGDLKSLSPEQRVVHYHNVCRSLGLNPLTQPFQYVTLNGKLQLYARRDAADQLRKLHGINIEIVSRSVQDGLMTVHTRARDKTGRTDEDYGVVSIAGLRGEAAANAMLKCVTKAKRRTTLSICGLGFLDETEVEDIPDVAEPMPANQIAHDPDTGELDDTPDDDMSSSEAYALRWERLIEEATSGHDLAAQWNAERQMRNNIEWSDPDTPARLKGAVMRRIHELKTPDLATQRLKAEDT